MNLDSTSGARLSRHGPALFGATPASIGTFLAVRDLMFRAFIAACFADVCAKRADDASEAAVARHELRGERADVGAISIETDALLHAPNVRFAETGGRTMLTRLRGSRSKRGYKTRIVGVP